jgi:hypothetical protein|tara:strand:+ start:216 stop:458 length:243 start_codon:yes stop_codon:yes gene_type:complete
MLGALATVVAAVLVFWLKRKVKAAADKAAALQEKLNKINKAIIDGDEDSVNSRIELLTNRLQDKDCRDPRRQGTEADGKK